MTANVREFDHQFYWDEKATTQQRLEHGRFNWFGRDPNWKDQLGYRGPKDVEKPLGEWNRTRVRNELYKARLALAEWHRRESEEGEEGRVRRLKPHRIEPPAPGEPSPPPVGSP